jgi:hypothetical protein
LLNPTLSQINQTIAGLNISRWKAPGEVRSATQQNADSIQRDLSGTLPGLLSTADAAPASVSAVFPVYRNIDALYDVLLRISETAELAAPQNEISSLSSALGKLESAHRSCERHPQRLKKYGNGSRQAASVPSTGRNSPSRPSTYDNRCG